MVDLKRPVSLTDGQWEALEQHRARLQRALRDEDWPLVVGVCKELCETVAKCVIDLGGGTVNDKATMPTLVARAHDVMDRRKGRGEAAVLPTREIASSASQIVRSLGDLRNEAGTGHGRLTPARTTPEQALIAVDSAGLWSRWALRRIDEVAASPAEPLIRDLAEEVFYKGQLAERLGELDLAELPQADQRRLGMAVGRRSASGTFVVRQDGMNSVAAGSPWTDPYRAGVVAGAFLDTDGLLRSTSRAALAAVRILGTFDDDEAAVAVAMETADACDEGNLSYAVSLDDRAAIADTVLEALKALGPEFRQPLERVAEAFRPRVGLVAKTAVWEQPIHRFLDGSGEAEAADGAFTLWEAVAYFSPERFPIRIDDRILTRTDLLVRVQTLVDPATDMSDSAYAWLRGNSKLAAGVIEVLDNEGIPVRDDVRALAKSGGAGTTS